ncbi:MAG: glutaredoxin family protein, partial [Thermus sp.]
IAELVGSPTAGVVLEWNGLVEAIRGVSPATLNAWLARYQAEETPASS